MGIPLTCRFVKTARDANAVELNLLFLPSPAPEEQAAPAPQSDITQPDGTVIKPDGTMVKPDGTMVKPDGTTEEKKPEAMEKKPISLEPYYIAYTADGAAKAASQGRPVVYYFWASWCPICRAEEPKVKDRIENSNLPIAGFRVNYDTETELKTRYKIPYQHTTVFLNKKGEEVGRLSGPSTDAEFNALLTKSSQ